MNDDLSAGNTPRQRRKIWPYALLTCVLAGVFLLYFRVGLVLDVANFIWRCA